MPTPISSIDIGQFETERLSNSSRRPSPNPANQSGGILGELSRKQQAEDEIWRNLMREKPANSAPIVETQVRIQEITTVKIEIGGSNGLNFAEVETQNPSESIQRGGSHGSISFKRNHEAARAANQTHHSGVELKLPPSAQKMGEKALEIGTKAGKRTYIESKTFGVAMFHLIKDHIFFRLKKSKDHQSEHEAADKKAKRLAVVKAFFAQLKEAALIFKNKKQEEEINEAKQLGIAGMSEEEKNELLGKNRNKMNKNISGAYFSHATAAELMEKKTQQQKAQKEQSLAETSKPVVNMHGAIEGGTGGGKVNISTTGGAGVG